MAVIVKRRPIHHFNDLVISIFQAIGGFIHRNTVLSIAIAAAVITSIAVPPDALYLGYFDF